MRIAFVNQRYGTEVNGGSEAYTRVMAEHMTKYYDVEVLTTQAKDYISWKNEYTSREEVINGVTVRRFPVKHERTHRRFLWASRFVRFLHCNLTERIWVEEQGPYVPELIQYLEENAAQYDVIVFATYLYYTSVMGIPKVRDKAVLIPTAHDESYIYFNCYKKIFHDIRGVIYLTPEEKELVHKIFHNEEVPSAVIGMGIDAPEQVEYQDFLDKYDIRGDYYVYAGRVDSSKGCGELFAYFEKYVEKNPNAQLVVIGKVCMEMPKIERMKVLGFVSDEEKYQAIAGAKALILPSPFESLSIVVLEAMKMGVPVLVNGACEVLKGHCIRSNGGGVYYTNYEEFEAGLRMIEDAASEDMKAKAKAYVDQYFAWEKVEREFKDFLDVVAGKTT